MYKTTILLLIILFAFQINAQEKESPSPILFILDGSGSMWGQLQGKTKKEIAADVLSTAVNNLPENQYIGLIAYGHRVKGDCDDIEFLADLKNNSKDKITKVVNEINPLGRTPLARSATLAINSLRESKTKATIILITDGIESCDGNICDVVTQAKADGIEFKLHIVGFGLKDDETEQLKCAAQAGDGQYYDAADAGGLSEGLTEATTATIDEPDVNFSIYAFKNGQPVDAMVRAHDNDGNRQPIIVRTYKDTAYAFLPPGNYNLEVKPLEGSDVDAITIDGVQSKEGNIVHKTVSFDGSKVQVTATNNGEGWDATVSIYNTATGKRTSQTRTYGKTQTMEINPGTYDITFKALVIKGIQTEHTFENVEVKAGESITLEHNFESGVVHITTLNNGEGWDATIKIYDSGTGQHIAAARTYKKSSELEVSPGTYDIQVKALKMNGLATEFTMKNVEVKAGETNKVEHNFKTGIANLGVSENGTLVDCTVSIVDEATGSSIAGARSYTSSNSNPRPFVLNPGNYKVKLRGRKNGKDTIKEFSITVEEGESFTKMYEW